MRISFRPYFKFAHALSVFTIVDRVENGKNNLAFQETETSCYVCEVISLFLCQVHIKFLFAIRLQAMQFSLPILGPYGSGKTIVCQKILENLVKCTRDDENQCFCYITCDEYSLLHCENKRYCELLERKYNKKILCSTLDEISKFGRYPCIVSLKRGIGIVAERYESFVGKKINFFVDEIDPETFDASEVRYLNNTIEELCADSIVVFSMQSISKNRISTTIEGGSRERKPAVEGLDGFVPFPLKKTMRFTTNVHRIVKSVQHLVSDHPSIYHFRVDGEFDEDQYGSYYDKSVEDIKVKSPQYEEKKTAFEEYYDTVDAKPEEEKIMESSFPIDTLVKYSSGIESTGQESGQGHMKTSFNFPEVCGSGHGIKGNIPNLVRIQGSHCEFERNPEISSINILAYAFKKFFKLSWTKTIVIITSLKIAQLTYSALKALRLQIIVYVPELKLDYPKKNLKDRIYSDWTSKSNCVLLTDHRGCRGLQHDKVPFYSLISKIFARFQRIVIIELKASLILMQCN